MTLTLLHSFPQTTKRQPEKSSKIEGAYKAVIEHDDVSAFRGLFKKYYTPLCYYSMKTVGNKEIAEEVVSDVFMKFWRDRHKIQIHTSFDAYIFRSVKNHSLDYLRSSLNEKIIKEPITGYYNDTIAADNESPINQSQYLETAQIIEEAISRLPQQCQLIFRMNRLDGLKYREVAQELNLSMKTIEAQVSKALKQLRTELVHQQYFLN